MRTTHDQQTHQITTVSPAVPGTPANGSGADPRTATSFSAPLPASHVGKRCATSRPGTSRAPRRRIRTGRETLQASLSLGEYIEILELLLGSGSTLKDVIMRCLCAPLRERPAGRRIDLPAASDVSYRRACAAMEHAHHEMQQSMAGIDATVWSRAGLTDRDLVQCRTLLDALAAFTSCVMRASGVGHG